MAKDCTLEADVKEMAPDEATSEGVLYCNYLEALLHKHCSVSGAMRKMSGF
jgi:hypothetical protein